MASNNSNGAAEKIETRLFINGKVRSHPYAANFSANLFHPAR